MKKGTSIFLILIFIIISLSILLYVLLNSKELSIKRATYYLKNKINSETPYYTKITTSGNIDNCTICKNTDSGSVMYAFFISQAIKNKLTKKEQTIILKNIDMPGENLWGYNGKQEETTLNDVDSTAFAMRTLAAYEKTFKLSTIKYFYESDEKAFISFRDNIDNKDTSIDKTRIYPEINANIYNLFNESTQKHNNLEINKNLIKNNQLDDGSFKNSYYFSKYYSTYMFLNFLCNYKDIDNDLIDIKNKGINFILNTQNKNGSWGENMGNNYETTLALISLKSCKINNKQTESGEKILVKKQEKDGSWISKENILWKFYYNEKEQWTSYVNDILSTSLSIMALK